MRCLGIPNTAHFANVTQIEDAVSCELIGADSDAARVQMLMYLCVLCHCSVGKAQVPESIRAVAARHRGTNTQQTFVFCCGVAANCFC